MGIVINPRMLIVLLLLWPALLFSQHENQAYLPLTTNELGPPFPLKKLTRLKASSPDMPTSAGPSGSTYRLRPGKETGLLTLQGQDKLHRPWLVELFQVWECGGGAEAYEADLDKDGIVDAVLLMPTCGNGLAPSVHMITVTFDSEGRPIPFEAEGYFELKPGGVDSLVDLNHDGKADLIFMNFNDGYWITNIYTVKDGRWNRIQGRFATRSFPLFTRFTNRPNSKAVTQPSGRMPWAPDLSTVNPVVTGSLVEWKWTPTGVVASNYLNLQLTVSDNAGKRTVCTTNYWYDSARLIFDNADGRQVVHFTQDEPTRVDSLLAEAVSQKLQMRLYGNRDWDHCSPELIWAEPR
jgi:hypothetical protein